jgi:hypothetical protein
MFVVSLASPSLARAMLDEKAPSDRGAPVLLERTPERFIVELLNVVSTATALGCAASSPHLPMREDI